MFTSKNVIPFNINIIKEMIQQKQYIEVKEKLNAHLKSQIKIIRENAQIYFGIVVILESKITDQIKNIINTLKTIHPSFKDYVYPDIYVLLLQQLFTDNAYDCLLTCTQLLIDALKNNEECEYDESRFICQLHTLRGNVYNKLNDQDSALEESNKALFFLKKIPRIAQESKDGIEVHQKDNSFLANMVNYYLKMADEERKAGELKRAYEKLKMAVSENELFLEEMLKKKTTAEVITTIRDANIKTCLIYSEMGMYDMVEERLKSSLRHFNAAIKRSISCELKSYTWFFLLCRGYFYIEKLHEIDKGINDFTQARSYPNYLKVVAPMEEESLNHLKGKLIAMLDFLIKKMLKEDDYHGVIKIVPYYVHFIENDPSYSVIASYFNLYTAFYHLKNYPEALIALNTAIKKAKDPDGDLFLCRAELYHDMGCFEKAREDLKKSRTLKTPNSRFKEIKNKIDISEEQAKQAQIAIQPITNNPFKVKIAEKVSAKKKQNNKKKHDPLSMAQWREEKKLKAEARELKKIKSIQNKSHEAGVTLCKQIVAQLVNHSISIAEELKQQTTQFETTTLKEIKKEQSDLSSPVKIRSDENNVEQIQSAQIKLEIHKSDKIQHKEENTPSNNSILYPRNNSLNEEVLRKWQDIFRPIAKEAAQLGHILESHNAIMSRSQFDALSILQKKINEAGGVVNIPGSSALAFYVAEIKHDGPPLINNDVDLQIRRIVEYNKRQIIDIFHKEKYTEGRKSSYYAQFRREDRKPFDVTLIFNEKEFDKSPKIIDLEKCCLILKCTAGNSYFVLDENKKILDANFRNGYFNVDLTGDLSKSTFILRRMIKYFRKLRGFLSMRVHIPGMSFIMDDEWQHPAWRGWLKKFVADLVVAGKFNSYCQEVDNIPKDGPEQRAILWALAEEWFCMLFPINDLAISNVYFLLREFYDHYAVSSQSVVAAIHIMLRNNPKLWMEPIRASELKEQIDHIAGITYATKVNTLRGLYQFGIYKQSKPNSLSFEQTQLGVSARLR